MALNDLQSVQTLALETLVGLESKYVEMLKTLNLVGGGKNRENLQPTYPSLPCILFVTIFSFNFQEICYLWAMVLLSTKIGLTLCEPLSNSR